MSDNFEKHIQEYYHMRQLTPEIKQRLLEMQSMRTEVHSETIKSEPVLARVAALLTKPKWAATAATLFCLLIIPAFMINNTVDQQQHLLGNIAAEVALNHNKRLPSDYVTGSYAELSTVMDKLDFALFEPQHKMLQGYQLTGARYCSLQGQIAGQLKLTNAAGEQHTLYVTRLSEKFSELNEAQQDIDGLKVSNWQSGGLFFSLAR